MTKRRRHKICKIVSYGAHHYVAKGKFDYLFKQNKLYRKHETYLTKMSKREFNRLVKALSIKYGFDKEQINDKRTLHSYDTIENDG